MKIESCDGSKIDIVMTDDYEDKSLTSGDIKNVLRKNSKFIFSDPAKETATESYFKGTLNQSTLLTKSGNDYHSFDFNNIWNIDTFDNTKGKKPTKA